MAKNHQKSFLDVQVGDIVTCYDEYSHDYVEHEVKVTSIEEDKENATETNSRGRVLCGDDLTYGDDEEFMICTVYESNFIRACADQRDFDLDEDSEYVEIN